MVPTALLVACLAITVWLSPSLLAVVVVLAVGLHFGTEGAALVAFRNFVALGGGLAEELKCSAELEVSYLVGQALNTDTARRCHDHLTTAGTTTDTFEQWCEGVIESAKTTGNGADRETVTFHVKGTHLWKNGEPVWVDAICHERLIPHESFADVRTGSSYNPDADGLRVRIVVRSGFLVLQLGGWHGVRADSQPGQEQKWKEWETICSFPVLFSVIDHYIAERFLLATYAVPPDGSVPTERDKRQLAQDLRNYRYICSAERLDSRCQQILQNFDARKKTWLKKYGFKTVDPTTYRCSLVAVKFVNRRLGNWIKQFGDEHHR
jgi:hypothetical protein